MKRTIALLTVMAIGASIAFGVAGEPAYAAASLSAKHIGGYSVKQNSSVDVTFEVKNNGENQAHYYVVLDAGDEIEVTKGNGNHNVTSTLAKGSTTTHLFTLNVPLRTQATTHTLTLTLYDPDNNEELKSQSSSIEVTEPQRSGAAAVDVAYTLSNSAGIVAGAENILNLEIFNRGGTMIKNTRISLELPEGISINNAASYVNAGYISVGSTYKTSFPIVADESMTSKNYPIVVKMSGVDSSNNDITLDQTLYIPVKGSGAAFTANDLEITNVSIPQQVAGGDDFTLNFEVSNRSTGKLEDTKVTVEVPEGLVNKTKNVFIISGLAAGNSQKCSVTLSSPNKSESKYQLLKITATPASGDSDIAISQYAGTMVKNIGTTNSKTPQLMISNYTYGGSYVQAGDEFVLNLGVYNTHASQDLYNIKVTVTSDDGTFVPVKSSNSFYIDRINTKDSVSHAVNLSAKRDAEQKTTSLTIDMSYEDIEGNSFTSKDVISIPVMQETRLVVDDVIAPPELYAGMQSGVSVNFYNMGKTVLNNLRVNVEGDFDAPQSNLYYVGNMETGKSDSYDFSFVPRQGGTMNGTVTFTYEDAAGVEQIYQKSFEFTIMEDVPWEDPGMIDPMPEEKKIPWIPIAAVVAAVAAIGGIIFWRKHRKKKLDQEMELDE